MLVNEEFFSDISGTYEVFDLYRYEPLQKYFYNDEPSEKDIKELNRWLKAHKDDYVYLYHGTSSKLDIMKEGLLRTTMKRRRSYQSSSGWVYLSIFPATARTFGEMGYPSDEITVYKARVKIKELRPDDDQLRNKRLWSGNASIGTTLGDSLCYGHGARVKRDLFPFELERTDF